jgi:UDP-arabinose 4-epimerase
MNEKRVLVVGGAGYIGSHTCKELKLQGFEPVVLDNLSEGHDWAVKYGDFVHADMGNYGAVARAIIDHEIGTIMHFGASAYVGESVANPRKYYKNNVSNFEILLGAALDNGVRRVIFSSSCTTFGDPKKVPVAEGDPQAPISPYGDTKYIGERMLKWYDGAYGLRSVAMRYFNASGADPDGEIGEVHDPETHLIPIILQAIMGKREKIGVFGTDYPTPDGTNIRDYVHVKDLADAHIRGLKHLLDNGESTSFNLGTGNGYSVKEVIDTSERVSGKKAPVVYEGRRPGDAPALWADSTKAKTELGWDPKYSDLETIVSTAWAWEQKRLELGY